MSTKPRLVVSIGDPNGIGPEVSLKTLLNIDLSQSTPIVAAPHHLVQRLIKDQKSYFSTSLNPLPTLHYITDENEIVEGAINVLESFDSSHHLVILAYMLMTVKLPYSDFHQMIGC